MPDRVTNEQVLAALRGLGYEIPPVDMSGAQNSTWKKKLYAAMKPQLGGKYPADEFDDIFGKAIGTAKKIADIPPNARPTDRLAATLSAYGVEGSKLNDILVKAQGYAKQQGRGSQFNDQDYADAASAVLGDQSPQVLRAFEGAGFAPPRPIGTAPFGSAADQAPRPTGPGGVTMGTAKSRATPGVAAPSSVSIPPPSMAVPPGPAKTPAAGGAKTTGGPTTDATGRVVDKGLAPGASDAEVEAYFRRNYGTSVWMLGIPDFKKLMRDVATNPSGFSQQIVTNEVQRTPWWQSNGQNVADFMQKKSTMGDAAFNQWVGGKGKEITESATKYGITLSPEKLNELATDALKWGWGQQEMQSALAGQFDYVEGQHTAFTDQLRLDARQYLQPLSEQTIDLWGKKLIENPEENLNWKTFLKEQAKTLFPAFAQRLDTGETMEAIAHPFAETAAKLLEIDPKDIDFMDQKWMRALDTVDDKGNHRSMAPAEWMKTLKTDGVYRYDYTEGAKQEAVGMATTLMQRFGVTA